jgi:rhodanese-related sulfurtransferase
MGLEKLTKKRLVPYHQFNQKVYMAYTQKFQQLADDARERVSEVAPGEVDKLMAAGAIALDIRDKEEHDADHIAGSLHISRGKLEMNVEQAIPDLEASILCYCNAYNRGALSADTLRAMGYRNASFIAGGLKAYRAKD